MLCRATQRSNRFGQEAERTGKKHGQRLPPAHPVLGIKLRPSCILGK